MQLPRIKHAQHQGGFVSSLRWGTWGWDMLYRKDEFFFAQYGKSPLYVFCVRSKAAKKAPMFLTTYGWKVRRKFRRVYAGHTTRPLNIAKYWRAEECNSGKARETTQERIRLKR